MRESVYIVLAAYNGEKYIKEQLDSLLGQTYKNLIIDVCDDGSSDGTLEVIKEYMAADERILLHQNKENLGYVRNFLEGAKRSPAPYVMFCDQDDIWNSDKVEITLREMKMAENEAPGKPVLVYTDVVNYNSTTGEDMGLFHKSSHLNVKKVDTAHVFMENKCIGCTMMMNHNVLDYLNKIPDEIRVHDWWIALICSHFGMIHYLPQPTMRYRQHEENQIGGNSFSGYLKERLTNIKHQRHVLHETYKQGEAFLRIYENQMSEKQRIVAKQFAGMATAGFFGRRYRMIRYGFWKSGISRNAGLFLLA